MNSGKTQVARKLKSLDKRLNNINRRLANNAPVAISTKNSSKGRDYYRTNGKERISDVTALNQSFNIVDVYINPANSSLFPWLSGIGIKYDLYRFKRLKFNYVPSLPTSEEGNVYIGIDYNTLDPSPANSSELCQLSHWTMNVVWKPNNLNIDLNNIDWLYTRSGPIANADYKTYDVGRMFLATEGINYNGVAGYIEVEYDVEFKRRQPDYINKSIPTTDVYGPIGSCITNNIAASGNSASFTSSFTNNSIINFDDATGTFYVNKDVTVLILASDALGVSTIGLKQSATKGGTYTTVTNVYTNAVVALNKGKYYKINNTTSASSTFKVSLIIVSNL